MDEKPQTSTPTVRSAPTVAGGPTVAPDVDAWKAALDAQEALCARHSFGAAVVSIALRPRDNRTQALAVLSAELTTTDIVGLISATEIGVVLVPLESIFAAQQRVQKIDDALRTAGIVAAVGWAMRQDHHGLFQAAARADAAVGSAQRRHVDLR
jgi:hypothetical protein